MWLYTVTDLCCGVGMMYRALLLRIGVLSVCSELSSYELIA
jgi:hypothetical protein